MDTEITKMTAIMSIEKELKECERARNNKEIQKNRNLYNSLIMMERDLMDLLSLFNEHNETVNMKGRFRAIKSKGKRKVIEARLVKKAFSMRNKYKKEIEEMNKILGD